MKHPGLLYPCGLPTGGGMKWFSAILAFGLTLCAPLLAQQAETSASADTSSSATVSPADKRSYLALWEGTYLGVCTYIDENGHEQEMLFQLLISGEAGGTGYQMSVFSKDTILQRFDGLAVALNIDPAGGDDSRAHLTADKISIPAQYIDPVAFDCKRVTGGFSGKEDLIDGEIKIYRISLNSAPRPMRTYRFRAGKK